MSKSKQPIIGITTYGRHDKLANQARFHLPVEYVDAVRRAGGIPVLPPPGEEQWQALLGLVDGLIIAGGGDLDPTTYNGNNQHPSVTRIDPERDHSEITLIRQVVEAASHPLLCICRGMQVLNIALGGSLMEHLPDEVGEQVAHRSSEGGMILHPVSVKPASHLGQLIPSEVQPASWHHQAVRGLAPGLAVVATAPDGIIEAVELPAYPWLVAVQWHPELTAATDATQQTLFDELVKAAQTKDTWT